MATNSTNFPKRSNNGRRCPQYSDTGFRYANPGGRGLDCVDSFVSHLGSLGTSQGSTGTAWPKQNGRQPPELRSWPSAFRTGPGAMGPGDRCPGMVCRAGTDSASDNAAIGPCRLPTITGVEMTYEGTSGALSPTAGRVGSRRWSNRPSRGRRSGLVRWTRLRRPSRWEGRDEKGSSASVRTRTFPPWRYRHLTHL